MLVLMLQYYQRDLSSGSNLFVVVWIKQYPSPFFSLLPDPFSCLPLSLTCLPSFTLMYPCPPPPPLPLSLFFLFTHLFHSFTHFRLSPSLPSSIFLSFPLTLSHSLLFGVIRFVASRLTAKTNLCINSAAVIRM